MYREIHPQAVDYNGNGKFQSQTENRGKGMQNKEDEAEGAT